MAKPLVARLLEDFCKSNGLRLELDDALGHAGCMITPNGRRSWFVGTRFDLNPLGAAELVRDKGYTSEFLDKAGLPVPRSVVVLSKEYRSTLEALRPGYLDDRPQFTSRTETLPGNLSLPLYVKPNGGSGGKDIERATTRDELDDSLTRLFAKHDTLVLQEEAIGSDVRVVVLEGRVHFGLIRAHASLTGDGQSSISELLEAKAASLRSDPRVRRELERQTLDPESIPEPGARVRLLPVANLGASGQAEVLKSNELASDLCKSALRVGDLTGLRYFSVDLIAEAPETTGTHFKILEVNAAPGFAELHRQGGASAGIVEELYERLFTCLKLRLEAV